MDCCRDFGQTHKFCRVTKQKLNPFMKFVSYEKIEFEYPKYIICFEKFTLLIVYIYLKKKT